MEERAIHVGGAEPRFEEFPSPIDPPISARDARRIQVEGGLAKNGTAPANNQSQASHPIGSTYVFEEHDLEGL